MLGLLMAEAQWWQEWSLVSKTEVRELIVHKHCTRVAYRLYVLVKGWTTLPHYWSTCGGEVYRQDTGSGL
jgi:hypothetical protein